MFCKSKEFFTLKIVEYCVILYEVCINFTFVDAVIHDERKSNLVLLTYKNAHVKEEWDTSIV
mgnify:CR=1 FL=1